VNAASGSTPATGAASHTVLGWSIDDHLAARRDGLSATDAVRLVLDALDALDAPAVLIGAPLADLALAQARLLDEIDPSSLPLHGVPFVVKDNIDVGGVPTTCACPSSSYVPAADAAVVARLRAAGAIPVAKVNLDQFATGLVGTRSPYGTPRNPIDEALVPGGSSSGSAVTVALGLVPFSLGTDTAGSGRVPAAMCRIVGLKPTVGRLPTTGVVPAVRRIDCVSVFARSVADARVVASIAAGPDDTDDYARAPAEPGRQVRRLACAAPASLGLDAAATAAYEAAVSALRPLVVEVVEVDVTGLLAAGAMLYGASFVAERTAAVGARLLQASEAGDADPVVASIVGSGSSRTATDAYRDEYRLAHHRAVIRALWHDVDALVLPTTPGVATLDDVAADPVGANARLGTFTTFTNLLDCAAIAVPLGERTDARPSGVQLIGPAWSDDALADLGAAALGERSDTSALRPGEVALAVVGAHLSGMALNHQLTSRGARLLRVTETAPAYRLFALAGTVPPKPGLRRIGVDADAGASIIVEVWALAPSAFASFVDEVPAPLGIGTVELSDGSRVNGFICEPAGFDSAIDITEHGGWRAYMRVLSEGARP
jgi:allophanate hydrolase